MWPGCILPRASDVLDVDADELLKLDPATQAEFARQLGFPSVDALLRARWEGL